MEDETFSADKCKLAFISSSIIGSGKKNVLKFFFARDNEIQELLPEKIITTHEIEDTDFGYDCPPSPPICKFIKTEEKSFLENQEEIKYNEYVTDKTDTKRLDKLFSILNNSPEDTNMTAFGNFSLVIKSFINTDSVKSDFLKYFYSRPDNFTKLINHTGHNKGYQVMSSILNMQKWYSDNSSALASQFLVHRLRCYNELAARLVDEHTDVECVESIASIFYDLLTDNKHIWDSIYFIDRVLLDWRKVDALVERLMGDREKVIKYL